MARVAEMIVEEWLNRQGYFTVRGLKSEKGRRELDLLAYRPADGDAIHVEVQASPKPLGYLGGATSLKNMPKGVRGYVAGKYDSENVRAVRVAICPGVKEWRRMLVYHTFNREAQQVSLLREQGAEPLRLAEVLGQLRSDDMLFKTDSEASHFVAMY